MSKTYHLSEFQVRVSFRTYIFYIVVGQKRRHDHLDFVDCEEAPRACMTAITESQTRRPYANELSVGDSLGLLDTLLLLDLLLA